MADTGKPKMPTSEAKKEGNKKRRKHKKPTAASGGAPSTTSSASDQSHAASNTRTCSDGATANVQISQDGQGNEHQEKSTAKKSDDNPQFKISAEIKDSQTVEILSQNKLGKERKASDTQEQEKQNQESKGRKDGELREKKISKEGMIIKKHVQNSPKSKLEDKDSSDGDLPRKETPKQKVKNLTASETPTAGFQVLSDKGSHTSAKGATANVQINQDRQGNKHQEKSTTQKSDNNPQIKISAEIKDSQTVEILSQNKLGKERKASDTQEQGKQNQESKGRKDGELRGKKISKEGLIIKKHVQNSPKSKLEDKDSSDGDLPRKETPKQKVKNLTASETPTAGFQVLSDKGSHTSAKGGTLQKGNASDRHEQIQVDKPDNKKDSTGGQQTAKFKTKAEVAEGDHTPKTKVKAIGGEQKPKAKGEIVQKVEGEGEQKSKAQLRAERRAVQEAQRAAKDAKKNEPTGGQITSINSVNTVTVKVESAGNKSKPAGDKPKPSTEKPKAAGEVTGGDKSSKKKQTTSAVNETEEQIWARKEKELLGKSLKIKLDNSILNLAFQYFHHNIVGANARCVALLATLKELFSPCLDKFYKSQETEDEERESSVVYIQRMKEFGVAKREERQSVLKGKTQRAHNRWMISTVIKKYKTPEEKELSRDLEKNCLNPCISYINYFRPISTSMGNAIRYLKYHINRIPSEMEDETAIPKLLNEIDNFIEVNINKAAEAVAHYAYTKIADGDVILVYAASSLIGQVLKTASKKGKMFHVIVVEGRPRSEGKSMLRFLVRCGIPCSYVYVGSASHAMSQATKVFLGAAAMFAIGDMYSRSGNSMIAALAKANNIPVLVCCETYKFTDKVQLHTGDSDLHTRGKDLVSIGHKTPILANYEEIGLRLLNLMYDVTGSEYITAVVTELGMLPCTSVPVVLRRQEDRDSS